MKDNQDGMKKNLEKELGHIKEQQIKIIDLLEKKQGKHFRVA